jgi:DNA gyrase subunit B
MIENGQLFIGMPPLYKIKEGNKNIYILNEKKFNKYVLNKIIKKYNIDLKYSVLKEIMVYYKKLERISHKYEIDIPLLESIIKFDSKKSIVKFIESQYDNLTIGKVNKNTLVNGFINGIYHNFIIDNNLVKDLSAINEFLLKNLEGYSSIKIDKKKVPLGSAMNLMWKNCLPKNRNRLKGLGEMDSNELWDTALNPVTRKLIKVNIDDIERAKEKFKILMGGGTTNIQTRRDYSMSQKKINVDKIDI